ncbi:hypothetical protein GLOIN_2v1778308 [Rhizophagus irregularis DAOM 181602=DAOM 197198]|nr:hypothetical protein GLOIN_2v1778308 [Rhizophagus irregularis DAOM 181602=DAOM 197198]
MNKIRKSLEPARNGINNIIVKIIEACNRLDSIYNELNNAILDLNDHGFMGIFYLPKSGIIGSIRFICADDKHKLAIGEEVATSTGIRNRKPLIPDSTVFAESDHDFTKLSLIPSVILLCKTPFQNHFIMEMYIL